MKAYAAKGPLHFVVTFLLCVTVTLLLGVPVVEAFSRGGTLPGPSGALPSLTYLATQFCALTGCTLTGQQVFSGVTTDISTGTNEDLTIAPNGTGATNIVGAFQLGGNKLAVYYTQPVVLGALASVPPANTVLGTFATGAAATLTRVDASAGYLTGVAGTGTGTLDITTTAGTSICAVTVDCTTMQTGGSTYAQAACATPALAANTTYQVRSKSQCAGAGSFGYLIVNARMTVP